MAVIMTKSVALDLSAAEGVTPAPAPAARVRLSGMPDDRAMLRAAAELTRDLHTPKPLIYWSDFIASALVGYAGLAVAILAPAPLVAVLGAIVAILALYRAGLFIHELTHVKHAQLPFFRFGWNALVGVPLLLPSFMYEGVHSLHHARTRYGTDQDPEYLPLALMKPWTLPVFLIVSVLAPIALLVRFAVLSPLSLLSPKLRTIVVARYSGLQINPKFERRAPEGELKTQWFWQELACSLFAIGLLAAVFTGVVPLRAFAIYLGVVAGVAVINQVRTLVAHLWENEGEPLTVTAQYLDSVNVPTPGFLPYLWAPVGLRYHALHHLLPGVPYHSLSEAHRRLAGALEESSAYHKANYPTLSGLVRRLAANTMKVRSAG
ncbi:fatty acid desaturase [Sphingomonas hengshuiensis]|uniref:Fatty acid desaturase n=2 Tax=Sphingomonas hengshuiensis TaxID=1609977 RepID=A0A7U4LF03_9SPHN|nr:fatty acid desaturase [Sphingomonas hengshuiensis]